MRKSLWLASASLAWIGINGVAYAQDNTPPTDTGTAQTTAQTGAVERSQTLEAGEIIVTRIH